MGEQVRNGLNLNGGCVLSHITCLRSSRRMAHNDKRAFPHSIHTSAD
jgi:hypothetical protein